MTITKRQPVQERSQLRRERILQATAELLNEMDYAAISVATIAEHAQTSVGSIYQFFANKDAILRALAESYLSDMRDSVGEAFRADGASAVEFAERAIDWITSYAEAHPGFHSILKSDWVSPEIRGAVEGIVASMIDAIRANLKSAAPHLSDEDCRVGGEIAMGITNGALPLISAKQGGGRARLVRELKRAIVAYVRDLTGAD